MELLSVTRAYCQIPYQEDFGSGEVQIKQPIIF